MTILLYALFSILPAYDGGPSMFDLVGRDERPCSESCKGRFQRTLFGIAWSCLSTTILCAWTAVHPNVPPRSIWKAQWNRLKLTFWMIVAPELVLAWAVRQYFAAKDIRDTHNSSRQGIPPWRQWTLAHGHLLGMGGISLVNPKLRNGNGQVLTLDRFKELIRVEDFYDLIDIPERDIHDRSKGDVLFKLIAILQTSWFIIQCVARGPQQLALTELELVTLALASLNVATFAIWWHKPLGVQEPVRIYWEPEAQHVGSAVEQLEGDRFGVSFGRVTREGWRFVKKFTSFVPGFLINPCKDGPITAVLNLAIGAPIAFTYVITFPFFLLFPLGIISLLKILETQLVPPKTTQIRGLLAAQIVTSLQNLRYKLSLTVGDFVRGWLEVIFRGEDFLPFLFGWYFLLPSLCALLFLFTIFLTLFPILLVIVSFIFTSVFGIVTTTNIRPGAPHVPSFYAPVTESDRWSRMVVFALFGAIFGGLHCVGWYFSYPTHSERNLWRATSLAITVIPLIVAPIDFLLAARLKNKDIKYWQKFERRALLVLDLIMTILLFVYVPARLSLIAQALALLRRQPSSALDAVDWTKYVPHLFSQ